MDAYELCLHSRCCNTQIEGQLLASISRDRSHLTPHVKVYLLYVFSLMIVTLKYEDRFLFEFAMIETGSGGAV